jgi:hypothetical protein
VATGGFGNAEKVANLGRRENGGAGLLFHVDPLKWLGLTTIQREEPAGSFSSVPQAKPGNLGK